MGVVDAVRIAIDVADALDYAHRSGIVHRDIKPENILLQQGRPVVSDFGIARLHEDEGQLTATGVLIGTPMYMAPEQITAGREVDSRADLYALGCVLFEMLTGAPPFSGPSARALMAQHMVDERPGIRARRPAVSLELERVVHRAMAIMPADRFASAGELRDALSAALHPAGRSRAWTRAAVVVVAAAAAAATILFVLTWRLGMPGVSQAGDAMQDSARVAVLPMQNLSPDSSDNYFAAGMTDEMISTLSDIGGMRVIARSAVMQYAGTTKSPAEIGRELGVGSIIESTIRKDGRRLRIGVRLIDANTQEQRWSQQYDREVSDLFDIQRDVARHVAQALRVRFGAREAAVLAGFTTTNPDALELYLRGRAVSRTNPTEAQVDSSIAFLTRAIAIDSNFAAAYAELADTYVAKLFRFAPGPRYRLLAERAIDRALALDSTLAEAYQARGDLEYTPEGGWRLEEAVRDFQRALDLKPSLSTAHGKFGTVLMHLGMYEPALRELRASVALDPFQAFATMRIGRSLWQSQKFDSALAAFETGPDIVAEHGMLFAYLGRPADGLAFLSTRRPDANEIAGDIAAARAVLYAQLGRRADAEREIRFVSSGNVGQAHFHHAAFSLGVANVLLGRPGEAVRWLTHMANGGMPAYELLLNDPIVKRLAGNREYEALMAAERRRYERLKAVLAAK